jgi:hypothetical protein
LSSILVKLRLESRIKQERLEAYARIRDDVEAQRQFAEIKLRACVKIGELSRDLPHGKPGPKPNKLSDTDVAQFDKEDVLERVGIGMRTAERYEELAGGREEQAMQKSQCGDGGLFCAGLLQNVTGALLPWSRFLVFAQF